jgi:hypothetical protein
MLVKFLSKKAKRHQLKDYEGRAWVYVVITDRDWQGNE